MSAHVILIAGATASGKSAVALRLAEALDGVVINADSMQLYRELRVLTARPNAAAEARIPHRLYGVWSVTERGSAGRWLALARDEIKAAIAIGKTPIFVGGAGLYFQVLLEGLAPVPEISEQVRTKTRELFNSLGRDAFYQKLARMDPTTASRVRPSDSQRLLRAYEVFEATGRPLADWQLSQETESGIAQPWCGYVLSLPRDRLYARIDARLEQMIEAGALDEVRALADLDLDPALPALRALGIPDLSRHVAGEIALEVALDAAKQATRRYAKRQLTWQRNKMHAWKRIDAQYSECFFEKIFPEISHFLLTPGV